jgi:hypothetical protein
LDEDDGNIAFFKEVSDEIYNLLPFDKKIKFAIELSEEQASETKDEDNHKERFFRLLHFLDVNYVKPIHWAKYVIDSARKNSKETKVVLDDQISLQSVYESLKESQIEQLFSSFLEDNQLKQDYLAYTAKQQGKRYLE